MFLVSYAFQECIRSCSRMQVAQQICSMLVCNLRVARQICSNRVQLASDLINLSRDSSDTRVNVHFNDLLAYNSRVT